MERTHDVTYPHAIRCTHVSCARDAMCTYYSGTHAYVYGRTGAQVYGRTGAQV